jgi:acid phosphatase family membrane protein YuiD
MEITHNICVWSGVISWITAQLTKMSVGFYRTRRLDFRYLVSLGGMPSAHSATVTGLATAIGLEAGFNSPVFAIALGFALIVMFDASTVRRSAGLQATLLNEIIDELFKEHHLSERKLKELLGHTRLEVFMGLIMGILVAMLVMSARTWF